MLTVPGTLPSLFQRTRYLIASIEVSKYLSGMLETIEGTDKLSLNWIFSISLAMSSTIKSIIQLLFTTYIYVGSGAET